MKQLSAEQIELINAYAPYNHAVWKYGGLRITNEERLSGRVELLVSKIREIILNNFTVEEIKNMSIVDIGCYDGWILEELSDLPFREMVGVEPRESNIAKANKIREILGIRSRIKFEVGDIESFGERKYDIVLCTGVLHHLESISSAIHKLHSICNKLLFIETICLSSKHISKAFKKEIEMKDVVYFNRTKICGLIGQKLESSYYDGSTDRLSVVSIPSVESLWMYLEVSGFKDIKIVIVPKTYNPILKMGGRSANVVAISALVGKSDNLVLDESTLVKNYELGLMNTVLSKRILELYRHSPKWFLWFIKIWFKNQYAKEIIKNIRFNPEDKLCLEYGKILYKEREYQGAINTLKSITQKLNADWRSVYRSFYLISRIYKDIGLDKESEHYKKLCLISNLKYPIGG